MALQGDLGSIPLADVIQLVSTSRRTGMLYVASADDARVFRFALGDLVGATSLTQRFRLGHALCERGLLDPAQLDEALAEQRNDPSRSLGEVLLARGAISEDGLKSTLRDLVQDALDDVLHWDDGGFLFADDPDEPTTPGGISFEVAPLLFESLRKLDEFSRLSKSFEDSGAIVEFTDDEEIAEQSISNNDAMTILEHIDGRRSLAQLRQKVPWNEHRLIKALALLQETGHISMRQQSESSRFMPAFYHDATRYPAVAPRAAARAVALATMEHAGAAEAHAAALADPGLAVAVIRTAANLGQAERAQFATVRDAVFALGEDVLMRVLVAAGLRGCYCRSIRMPNPELWRHSLVTAIAAARISSALGMPNERAAEAYLCGLLHDVGAMVLRNSAGRLYEEVERLVASGTALHDAECRVLGIGHDKIGAHALEAWGAAPGVIEVALSHHIVGRTEPWQLAIVSVADALARNVGYDAEGMLTSDAPLEEVAMHLLGMSADLTRRVAQEVSDEASGRDPLW